MSGPQNIEPEGKTQESAESEGETHGVTPSRSAAVRKALEAGFEGQQEGIAWVRQRYGLEISPSQFAAAKATEKKKGWTRKGKPGRKPKATNQADDVTTPSESQDDGEDDPIE